MPDANVVDSSKIVGDRSRVAITQDVETEQIELSSINGLRIHSNTMSKQAEHLRPGLNDNLSVQWMSLSVLAHSSDPLN